MPTILDTVLIPDIITAIDNQTAKLVETDKSAKLKLVQISNIPIDSTLIKGEDTQIKNFFRNIGRGHNMRCDYLLVANNTIFFIELKTNADAPVTLADQCINKFKAAKCVVEYFNNVLFEFNKLSFFNQKEKRFVLFHLAPSINKTTTSLRPLTNTTLNLNDRPEHFKSFPITNGAVVDFSKMR
jgi:hypothetical protein